MTLQQMRYAIGVADAGSFSRAAEKLFVSQPSLTAAIHDLEREFAFPLFTRTVKGVTVTERGTQFIADIRELYGRYEEIRGRYSGETRKCFGVSTLYYSFARKSFVDIVKKFGTDGWDFSFRELCTDDVIEDIASRRSEVGIINVTDENRPRLLKKLESRGLQFRHLTECTAFVCLWKEHPLADRESLSLDELSGYHFVMGEHDDLPSFFPSEILHRREFQQCVRTADRSTVLSLLRELNGYTFLTGIIGEEIADDDFVAIPLNNRDGDLSRPFELGYITRSGSKMSNISLCYMDDIRRTLHIAGFAC